MTGFGAASAEVDGTRYAVEIRSVNNKYLKAQMRVPDELLALEAEIESALSRRLARGSITVTVRVDFGVAVQGTSVNREALGRILTDLEATALQRRADRFAYRVDLANLLTLPGILVQEPDRPRPRRAPEPPR